MLQAAIRSFIYALIATLALPFGLALTTTPGGDREQRWLNAATKHLVAVRLCSTDPDLNTRLDYAIQRYNKIGRWDVAFLPLEWLGACGLNDPLCPGIALDPALLDFPPRLGAEIVLHEALHDYYPWLGHAHINPVIEKYTDVDKQIPWIGLTSR
jgi:hypothetical protein